MAIHANTPAISVNDPRGLQVRSLAYLRSTDADEAKMLVTQALRDAIGRIVSERDPRTFDALGRDPGAPPNVASIWSLSGQRLFEHSRDAAPVSALFGVDGTLDTRWAGSDEAVVRHRWSYDSMGRTVAMRESLGDSAERLAEVMYYAASSEDDALRNRCGRLITRDDAAGRVSLDHFSCRGAPLSESRQFLSSYSEPDWPGASLEDELFISTRERNALDEVTAMVDADGNRRTLLFDVAGDESRTGLRVGIDGQSRPLVESTVRDAEGRMVEQVMGNRVVVHRDFDPLTGLLRHATTTRTDGVTLQDLVYRYDRVGNPVEIVDAVQPVRYFRNRRVDGVDTFSYDSLSRLVECRGREAIGAGAGEGLPVLLPLDGSADTLVPYGELYTYDDAGNLVQCQHVGTHAYTVAMRVAPWGNRAVPWAEGESEPAWSQLFDPFGLPRKLLPSGAPLSWNGSQQLKGIVTVRREGESDDGETYVYDGAGSRVRKLIRRLSGGEATISGVRYLPGLEIHDDAEGAAMKTAIAGHVRVLYWKRGKPPGLPEDASRYAMADHLGSVSLELDGSGHMITAEGYRPFGGTAWWAARSAVEASYKAVRFSGEERDASGLYCFGNRYYAPWQYRWISADPAGDADGLNRFRYAKNGPVGHVDRSGLKPVRTAEEDAERSYMRMWSDGRDWAEGPDNGETNIQAMQRISRTNLEQARSRVPDEHMKVASRFANLAPSDVVLTHFSATDFRSDDGSIEFLSRQSFLERHPESSNEFRRIAGNTPASDLEQFATDGFVFHSISTSIGSKTSSRFGKHRFETSMDQLGSSALAWGHVAIVDALQPHARDISSARLDTLPWFREGNPGAIDRFLKRRGYEDLTEPSVAKILFSSEQAMEGIGLNVAADLHKLSDKTAEAVKEWLGEDRPVANVGEVMNAFFRPQYLTPDKLVLGPQHFTYARTRKT